MLLLSKKSALFGNLACTATAALAAGLLAGCGSGEKTIAPMELAANDIAGLASADPSGAAAVDSKYHGTFSAIFGGTSGAQVLRYYNERVHHLVDLKKIQFTPSEFNNENWLTPPAPPPPPEGTPPDNSPAPPPSHYQVGALNIGTLFWLEGLVNQVPVTLTQQDGPSVPLDSSRVGIVILGEGYKAAEKLENGNKIKIPMRYRQAILLHEARHSDCTGGITEGYVTALRGLKDAGEFERTFQSMPCGHLHRVCQDGDLKGIAACDSEPWGAYTVGSIYALASYLTPNLTDSERAIYKAQFADQISRVQVNLDSLLDGKLGKPDMSHQGYSPDTTPPPGANPGGGPMLTPLPPAQPPAPVPPVGVDVRFSRAE